MTLELGTIAANVEPRIEFLSREVVWCETCGGKGIHMRFVSCAVVNGMSLAHPKIETCPTCKGTGRR